MSSEDQRINSRSLHRLMKLHVVLSTTVSHTSRSYSLTCGPSCASGTLALAYPTGPVSCHLQGLYTTSLLSVISRLPTSAGIAILWKKYPNLPHLILGRFCGVQLLLWSLAHAHSLSSVFTCQVNYHHSEETSLNSTLSTLLVVDNLNCHVGHFGGPKSSDDTITINLEPLRSMPGTVGERSSIRTFTVFLMLLPHILPSVTSRLMQPAPTV